MDLYERTEWCGEPAAGGPCGRRKGHDGHHATIAARHLDEKDDLRKQLEGAVDALYEIATQPFADGTTPRQKARSTLLAMGLDWRTTTGGR